MVEQTSANPGGQIDKHAPPKGGLNLIEILKDYVENMLQEC